MKTKLFFLFSLVYFCVSSQTTHPLDWSFNSANQEITIEVGDTVEWTWSGAGTHNLLKLSGPEAGFGTDSQRYSSGYVYSHTFTTVGVNTYECSPHPDSMYGTVTVTSTAGVSENNVLSFDIYPNPASDELSIQLPQGMNNATISVFDYVGRLIKTQSLSSDNATLDVRLLSSGLYLISINADGKIGTQRFIKK